MSNEIEFKLLAPNNKAVSLIGSFSDWNEIPMEKDDKGYYRTSVKLDDGAYEYKFRVQSNSWTHQPDEWVEIDDPYARELHPDSCNSVIRIKDGQRIVDDYVWTHDDKPLPANNQLIIYELFISDFSSGDENCSAKGQYEAVIEKLDYLCGLGINAIELMPVNAAPEDASWGYLPSFFFAPNPKYGSTKDLKRFIDTCHGCGIRVILDQLYNHSSDHSPLLAIDRDYWYYHDRHHPDRPEDYWGPEFNYETYDERYDRHPAWELMGDVVRYWIEEYHIDGIRFDAVKEIDNPEFMNWVCQQTKLAASMKPFYNIGERIPDTPEVVRPEGALDACWRETFYYFLTPHLKGEEEIDIQRAKELLDPTQHDYPDRTTGAVHYLSSHDRPRLLDSLKEQGFSEDDAFQRIKLGAVMLMTAVGVPMILMGEEFGEVNSMTPNSPHPLDWSLIERDRNADLLTYYRKLFALRRQFSSLQNSNIDFFHEDADNQVLAYQRWNEESCVVVVLNLKNMECDHYHVHNIPQGHVWHDWLQDTPVELHDDQLICSLRGYEARVYILR
ncbi:MULTISPECIES: alpha-amylase family glycosyl hydrolase [unclassified Leptolyngbya]|uniref:alpha-amylase family glycosyl hydrolase n=1 Tax=unclassified Leptolyngbya TaxID=2650499 RepID=UPI001681F8B8|nr:MULTISPECIES: alpha-amylase family glycosyl hydrolase [unclassified Leptolyngbya]MBD1911841.1 alpha amylase C-terminal domain-containing protein [Leptolyngbya sp. FACHB-8]MBD2158206.1 alpha amylase C-terminal domain-containing protein [Leptolyngbya sp. FACHB-16]